MGTGEDIKRDRLGRDEPPARSREPWFAPEPQRWGKPLFVQLVRAWLVKQALLRVLGVHGAPEVTA
jgi:hypothetical protein